MKNYTITNQYGEQLKRISKTEARKRANRGESVGVCACNMNPCAEHFNMCSWFHPLEEPLVFDGCKDFDSFVNSYEYYNCSHETGYYAAFWIQIKPYPAVRIIEDIFKNAVFDIAVIRDTTTGENYHLTRYGRNGMPYLMEKPAIRCGYYESRLDLFTFACDQAGLDYDKAVWIDRETLEMLDYFELCDEYADMCEELEEC